MGKWFLQLMVLLILISCKTETVDHPMPGLEYCTYEVGSSRVYWVDSVHYSRQQNKTFRFQYLVKEEVTGYMTDNEGREVQRLEEWYSWDTGKNYTFRKAKTLLVNHYGAEWMEDNRRYVRLSFPIKSNYKWDANIYNNLGKQDYAYEKVQQPFNTGFLNFSETIGVKQLYDSTLIYLQEAREMYGKDVGLVYKVKRKMDTQPNKPLDGYEVYYKLQTFIP